LQNDCAVDVIILSRNCEVIRLTSPQKVVIPAVLRRDPETKNPGCPTKDLGHDKKYLE